MSHIPRKTLVANTFYLVALAVCVCAHHGRVDCVAIDNWAHREEQAKVYVVIIRSNSGSASGGGGRVATAANVEWHYGLDARPTEFLATSPIIHKGQQEN